MEVVKTTTFDDDIKIIKNAVYGKEMRPAIVDALTKSWSEVKTMMGAVDQLNARVDNLPSGGGGSGGGGTIDPDNPDTPSRPTGETTSYSFGNIILALNGKTTLESSAGIADKF